MTVPKTFDRCPICDSTIAEDRLETRVDVTLDAAGDLDSDGRWVDTGGHSADRIYCSENEHTVEEMLDARSGQVYAATVTR